MGPKPTAGIAKTQAETALAKVRVGAVHAQIEHLATQDQALLQNMDLVKARTTNVLLRNRYLPYDEQLKGFKAETDRLLAQHLISHQSYQDLLAWARDRNNATFRAAEIGVQGYNAQTGRMNAETNASREQAYAQKLAASLNGAPLTPQAIQKELTRVEGERQKRMQVTDPITGRVKQNPLAQTDDLDAYAAWLRRQATLPATGTPAQPVGGGLGTLPPNAGITRTGPATAIPKPSGALPAPVRKAMDQSRASGRPWGMIARDMARMPEAVAYAQTQAAAERGQGKKTATFDAADVAAIRNKLAKGWSPTRLRGWYLKNFKNEYQVADAILRSLGK